MKSIDFINKRVLWLIVALFALSIPQVWAANQTYTLVAQGDLSSLTTSDKVLIVGNDGSSNYYALKNQQMTSNSNLPTTSVTITSNTITADLEDDYTWTLDFKENQTIGGNSYPSFYVKSTAGNYYLSNSGNIGSIVNTKNATDNYNVWAIGYQGSFTNKNGTYYVTGLYNIGCSRMLVYYSSDWRCYASSNWNNVGDHVVQIYKMQTASCGSATPSATGTASLNGSVL